MQCDLSVSKYCKMFHFYGNVALVIITLPYFCSESLVPSMEKSQDKSILKCCLVEIYNNIDKNRKRFEETSRCTTVPAIETPSTILRKMKKVTI